MPSEICATRTTIKEKQGKKIPTYPIYIFLGLDDLALLIKVIMQGKLFQRCTHLLYCRVCALSLGVNVNTTWITKPDMGSIFHIQKSLKYSGQMKLLCELSKLSKWYAFILLNTDASSLVYKFRPGRTGFNIYAEYTHYNQYQSESQKYI